MAKKRTTGKGIAKRSVKPSGRDREGNTASFSEAILHLVRELQGIAQRFYRSSDEPEEMRKGVVLFMANGLQAATELTRINEEPIAGWMVARALWHNAGCFALFLLDKRGHRVIADLLDHDNDKRAERVLVNEVKRILGEAEARQLFEQTSFDPKELQAQAEKARAYAAQTEAWENIRVRDLQAAVRRLCDLWQEEDPGVAQLMRKFVDESDMARTRGDTLAHPNLFGVQTVLQVADLDEGRITLDATTGSTDPQLKQIVAIQILLMHAATLAIRFPGALDIHGLLKDSHEKLRQVLIRDF